MNRNESKYFNTSVKMNKAFLEILEKKDFEYITVKEICEKAGVNRSTFYLHYETIGDLLEESVDYINKHFLDYMDVNSKSFIERLYNCSIDELFFITPKYLKPYLEYVKENKRLIFTVIKKANTLNLEIVYGRMFKHIFSPIMERFGVEETDKSYIMSFYISGLMAIITEWLKNDCADSIDHIIDIMQRCVKTH